jgi:hypothetical protein
MRGCPASPEACACESERERESIHPMAPTVVAGYVASVPADPRAGGISFPGWAPACQRSVLLLLLLLGKWRHACMVKDADVCLLLRSRVEKRNPVVYCSGRCSAAGSLAAFVFSRRRVHDVGRRSRTAASMWKEPARSGLGDGVATPE